MITISILGAEFFAYHGFYPEEQKLGTKFIVDAEVSFKPLHDLKDDKISNTVDYEKVYNIIDHQMKQTRKLIETVAQSIADDIKEQYNFVDNIRVSIKKLNPPLNGKVDYSSIVISI
ncbi:dihydroneopterin aldolase [Mucilaginibacter frigoritolerans]|uniref:7,8-dihydroneopterin aldolase n=1 Tax=Mucilaginibacter frigoritolerans TaxID=652788 RepID=A0A562TYR5_9SPHI|nr:dihydroneopterin aldolase [Mucilaginibacter frigoritolerans]TWI98236.1 dihydroneopterin aldolase [Mucilaginibacter frigoritolerans]